MALCTNITLVFVDSKSKHLPIIPRSQGHVLIPGVDLFLELINGVAAQSVSVGVELDRMTGGALEWRREKLLIIIIIIIIIFIRTQDPQTCTY